eukprot:gene8400-225_t
MKSTNVKACIRIRPLIKGEKEKIKYEIHNNYIQTLNPKNEKEILNFEFDAVYDEKSSQQEIFENEVTPIVNDHICKGFNSTIFCYGRTSSGKTFTMEGNEKNPGLILQTVQYLFQKDFHEIVCSMYEIYGNKTIDLMTKNSINLQIKEDKNKNFYVQNLSEKKITSFEEFKQILISSQKQRKTGSTNQNLNSSRSHSFISFQIKLKSGVKSKLVLIDLAGSENNKQTGNTGIRMKESTSINSHLSHLKALIESLQNNKNHVNYRNSNLTKCLKDSLGGHSNCCIIGNVSFCQSTSNDCFNTLKFVLMGRRIVNTPVPNETNLPKIQVFEMNEQIPEIGEGEFEDEEMEERVEIVDSTNFTPYTKLNYAKSLLRLGKQFEDHQLEISLKHYKEAQQILQNDQLSKKIDKLETRKANRKLVFSDRKTIQMDSIFSVNESKQKNETLTKKFTKSLCPSDQKENINLYPQTQILPTKKKSISFSNIVLEEDPLSKSIDRIVLTDKSSKLKEKEKRIEIDLTIEDIPFEQKLINFVNEKDFNELKKLALIGDKGAERIINERPFESKIK